MIHSVWQRKKRDKKHLLEKSVTRSVLTNRRSHQVKCTVLSQTSTHKQFAVKHSGLRITVRNNSIHKGLLSRIVLAGYQLVRSTKLDLVWAARPNLTKTTVMGRSFHYAEEAYFFKQTYDPNYLQQFLEEYLSDQSLRFRSWNSWPEKTWDCCITKLVITELSSPEEGVVSWMKFMFPMQSSDPLDSYSVNFRK